MFKKSRTFFLYAAVLAVQVAASPDSLVWDQFDAKLKLDAGQVVNGFYVRDVEFLPINRNTVVLSQSAKYGESWEFNAGFEGILWWPFGAGDFRLAPEQRTVRVEPRLSQAKARLNFAQEPGKDFVELGFFPYKYNPDARNLGEYLYRSGTYPGFVQTTDGFHLMDHAFYDAYGAHFHASSFNGLVTQDLNFFVEPNIVPTGDITPGYELSLSKGPFQFGMGAVFTRLISFNPDKTRPNDSNDNDNRYIEVDSSGVVIFKGPYTNAPFKVQQIYVNGADSIYGEKVYYYTQRGIKLMARASLDLGFLIPENLRGAQDLRIFTEAAILGVKDQPYYYGDIWQRIPIMAGINLPTAKVLDLLSFQMEYYGSRFNDDELYLVSGYPVWNKGRFTRDDWKWSVYAEKTFSRLFKLHVQIANDHMRLPELTTNPSATDITINPSHWYYLVRLEFGG